MTPAEIQAAEDAWYAEQAGMIGSVAASMVALLASIPHTIPGGEPVIDLVRQAAHWGRLALSRTILFDIEDLP